MHSYYSLISKFIDKGYKVSFFNKYLEKGSLILRHDIDFDIEYAHQLSLIEDELGVKSTYFFLMHSLSYNILEASNLEKIKSIQSRGYQISIHFDPTLYSDTIQLLTHPIWWMTKSSSPVSKLQEYLGYRVDKFKQHMGSNCMPYKKYLEENK